MEKIVIVLSLFYLVCGKTLHDVNARIEKKAMRQQYPLGPKYRVIPVRTTFLHGDKAQKNYDDALRYCQRKGAMMPTVISQEQKTDFLKDTSYNHWLGAVRNDTGDKINTAVWKWPHGENMTTTGLTGNEKERDEHHNCLTLKTNKKYKDVDCSLEAAYPACEMEEWRRYHMKNSKNAGKYDVKIKNTFIIVQDPRVEYDKAKVRCEDLRSDAKLANFFTKRELEKIDDVFTSDDVYFHENDTEWRFWIGAKAVDYFGKEKWTSNDRISTSLRTVEDRHGLCLHYHIKKKRGGTLATKFTWSKCRPNDDAGMAISGYICKVHKAFTGYSG